MQLSFVNLVELVHLCCQHVLYAVGVSNINIFFCYCVNLSVLLGFLKVRLS